MLQPTMVGAPPGQAPPARRRRAWPLVVAVCVALLLMTVAGVMFALRFRNRQEPVEVTNTSVPVDAAAAAKKASDDKLTEAEGLLAAGDLNGAIARMREAVTLDPSSVKAHRRLAEVLSESGARREAIEEFLAVTRIDPNDFTAWRSLAFAQLGEGLYAEAAGSFTRLLALTGEARQDPQDLLGYADALRQSGRGEEARAVYQKLSSVSVAEIAASARQRLAEMQAAQTAPSPEPTRTPQTEVAQNPDTARPPDVSAVPTPVTQTAPTPAPTPPAQRAPSTPEEHYTRGVSLWSSNRGAAIREFRAAGNHPDAHYYLGLSYVEGRDLGSLKRAEIVAALQHFQIARRGRFSGQAQQYERQLGREFDRLRN
jgi:tetratricopeptide (TPR) repeat protein